MYNLIVSNIWTQFVSRKLIQLPGWVAHFEGLGASYTIAASVGPQPSPLMRPCTQLCRKKMAGFQEQGCWRSLPPEIFPAHTRNTGWKTRSAFGKVSGNSGYCFKLLQQRLSESQQQRASLSYCCPMIWNVDENHKKSTWCRTWCNISSTCNLGSNMYFHPPLKPPPKKGLSTCVTLNLVRQIPTWAVHFFPQILRWPQVAMKFKIDSLVFDPWTRHFQGVIYKIFAVADLWFPPFFLGGHQTIYKQFRHLWDLSIYKQFLWNFFWSLAPRDLLVSLVEYRESLCWASHLKPALHLKKFKRKQGGKCWWVIPPSKMSTVDGFRNPAFTSWGW